MIGTRQREFIQRQGELVARSVQRAVVQLAEAHDYARDVDAPTWQYAVEIGSLKALGASDSDLKLLVARRYVEHAREVTRPGDAARRFAPPRGPGFSQRSCFVLTEAGLRLTAAASSHAPQRKAA